MANIWFDHRESCPACESTAFELVFEAAYDDGVIRDYLIDFYSPQGGIELEYLAGARFILQKCVDCGMIFQEHIPNTELMSRLYEQWIDPDIVLMQRLEVNDRDYYSKIAQEIMQIVDFLGERPTSLALLDFGMGWGEWALMAKAFGCQSFGSELSTDRLEFAEKCGIGTVSWEEIPTLRFDFINTEQVFEHLASPLSTLKHLKRAMKPEGMIKISVPHTYDVVRRLARMDWSAPKGHRNSLNAVAPLEHINCFSRKSIITMGKRVGLKERQIPLSVQYRNTTGWSGARRVAKNIAMPILRNLTRRLNYVFLRPE